MNRARALALAALVLCGVPPASAQDQLVTMFTPDTQRRWDAAGFVGWRGVNKSELAPSWNEWYDAAAFGISAGRYLTPHLKIDLDLSTTSVGRVESQDFLTTPGTVPYYYFREYRFRRTTLAPALVYQFFENRWVHPFLGVGVEGVRETQRLEIDIVPGRGPLSMPAQESDVSYRARPFLTGGLKFYVSERGFIRTDVVSAFSSDGAESAVWRVGAGVDF
jgi:hypothetical protein